jgi:AraC-like DNA-binding protein
MNQYADTGLSEHDNLLSRQLSPGARCLSGNDQQENKKQGGRMQPTTIASWAAVIWRALESRDIAPRLLFERAGVNTAHLHDAGARISVAAMTRLWNLAIEETNDPCFGISAGQHVHPTTFHALGYAWLASSTLREALDRFVRYTRLVSTALTLRTIAVGDEVELNFEAVNCQMPVSLAGADAGGVALVTLCRISYGETFCPLRVRLQRPRATCEHQFDTFFRAPVVYGAADNALVFSANDLDRVLSTGNVELARAADAIILQYLANFDRDDVVTQVRMKLLDMLPSGQTSSQRIAETLHMSVRNLQRKLSQQGTSLARLLEETRRELANQYVHNSRLSVGEMTYLLGFSEPASFTRAFHRWYGTSPSALRRTLGASMRC